jgi:GH24 family phage-related lysozyme (muramidase)
MMPKPGDYAQNFNQQQPHHMAWLQAVLERLVELDPKALDRDQPLYSSWMPPQAQQQQDSRWLEPARKIVAEFEGCKLEAYRDAVGVLTIGYGHTGPAVVEGMKITQSAADLLLQQDLARFHASLLELLPMIEDWPGDQQAALVSWAFNVGLGAVKTSTLRQKLLAGQDPAKVVREELPRWNKAGGKELAGLTRRRAAEVALFTGTKPAEPPATPGKLTPASPFSANITPHIKLGEFALNQEVRRFDHQHQIDTAAELAAFLERARTRFGNRPVIITSGYRPPAVNRNVGGASQSEHLYNAPGVGAVDFYIDGVNIQKVQDWCDKEWPYSVGYGAPKGFVHLGIRANRPRVRWDY